MVFLGVVKGVGNTSPRRGNRDECSGQIVPPSMVYQKHRMKTSVMTKTESVSPELQCDFVNCCGNAYNKVGED